MTRIAGILLLLLLAGCASDDNGFFDGDGGNGQVCTTEARASVMVRVVDQAGAPLTGAVVTYTVDGSEPMAAELILSNQYVAGWETRGDFVITASLTGFVTAQATATVTEEASGCHVISESVELTLLPQP